MLQCTCDELLAHPGGLDEILLLDTPTDPGELASLLFGWFIRANPGGTCLIYLRNRDVAAALCQALALALCEVARDDDATWYELRRPAYADKYDQLAAFTGETRLAAAIKCREGTVRTKREWEGAATETAHGRREFYGSTDAYLYELVEYEQPLPPDLPVQPAAGRHFELAHGTGRVLLGVAQHSFGVGYDLSEVLRAFVRFRVERFYPHLADRLEVRDEWDSLPPASFDVVHAYHVLEHLEDPLGTLARLVGLLLRGGAIHVIAPFDAVGDEYPEHNPALAHLTVPGLFAEVGLTVADTYQVGAWTAFVGLRA